jgi:2-aminoadipate transaminase
MEVSVIREILKVVSQPDMISLAGGIPAPQSFPMDIMNDLFAGVLERFGSQALQYDRSEGFTPFRQALAEFLHGKGIRVTADDLLVFSGSQAVLDALGKVMLSASTRVAVEAPTYLGALQAFAPYAPQYIRLQSDDQGLIPESLEAALKSNGVTMIYLVPTFQNPTGRTLPLARRKAIAALIQRYNALLIEDDPYRDLRYHGQTLPTIKQFAPDHVVYVGTMSKIFAPGLRLGYCAAPRAVHQWLVVAKQGTDLHTGTLNQALAAEYLNGGYLEAHLPKICHLYRPKLAAILAAIDKYLPAEFKCSRPQGGMFVWVQAPVGWDMQALYWEAIAQKVAFVPGQYFFAHAGEGAETMRLNFTMAQPAVLETAIKRLAGVIAAHKVDHALASA